MHFPQRLDLPFFAYGAFRPGQLAFLRLKPFVESADEAFIRGRLLVRDGLPIVDVKESGEVPGFTLTFRSDEADRAYGAIVDLEPERQYRWCEVMAGPKLFNMLVGRSPRKGSVVPEKEWDGSKDPLFTDALEVVSETLEQNKTFAWDLRPMFRLQMAYLLLWSAIERYVSLRYSLGGEAAFKKVMKLSTEPAFVDALRTVIAKPREVYRADRPEERICLNASDPGSSLEYYYQIRSNIVHRGKGVPADHDRVLASLEELLRIFNHVLEEAFAEAALDS